MDPKHNRNSRKGGQTSGTGYIQIETFEFVLLEGLFRDIFFDDAEQLFLDGFGELHLGADRPRCDGVNRVAIK